MSTSDKTLAENICRVVGHDWEFPKCARCGHIHVIRVTLNGIELVQSTDYVQTDNKVIFLEHLEGRNGTVQIVVGQESNGPWGILKHETDGGVIEFEVNDRVK